MTRFELLQLPRKLAGINRGSFIRAALCAIRSFSCEDKAIQAFLTERKMREENVQQPCNGKAGLRELGNAHLAGFKRGGGAGESRTPDTQFRKLLLYPSELQPRFCFQVLTDC